MRLQTAARLPNIGQLRTRIDRTIAAVRKQSQWIGLTATRALPRWALLNGDRDSLSPQELHPWGPLAQSVEQLTFNQ